LKYQLSILFILFNWYVNAQELNTNGNLPHYYEEKLNFGFLIGFNQAGFNFDPSTHFEQFDSLKTISVVPQPGFNLGIVSDYAFHRYVTLRFTPNIAFCGRTVNYLIQGARDSILYVKNIESTFLNFPVDLRLRSKRVKNFGAYVLAGGVYSLDLATKKNLSKEVSPVLSQQLVRLKRDDFYYEVGAGAEFYLMYFKFAIEAKMSFGTRNLLIKDNTIFSNSINSLNSRMFLISFTFEG
jgi:hypothetical protein